MRNLRPNFFKNELLGTANPLVALLFAGLWCLADKEGRLEDRPLRIQAEVFPYRPKTSVDKHLAWLHDKEFILRYCVGDGYFIQIINFSKHQYRYKTEMASTIPPPPVSSLERDTTILDTKEYHDKASSLKPSPSPSKASSRALSKSMQGTFNSFWGKYPRKVSRGNAEDAWKSLNPSASLVTSILAALENAQHTEQWSMENGKYIPYPASWLRAKGWLDDYSIPACANSEQQSIYDTARSILKLDSDNFESFCTENNLDQEEIRRRIKK
jgi:post-segregation antitoxin (ccd killing protein)